MIPNNPFSSHGGVYGGTFSRTLLLTVVAILVVNLSPNPEFKDAAMHIYVAGNGMAAFGAVASIGAFIYGQAMKDEIPLPVLRDQGVAITRTWSACIRRHVKFCTDRIGSVFRWPARERVWPSLCSGATSSTTLLGEDIDSFPFGYDIEIGKPPKVKQKTLQTAAIIWI